jgi:hypothetical protein
MESPKVKSFRIKRRLDSIFSPNDSLLSTKITEQDIEMSRVAKATPSFELPKRKSTNRKITFTIDSPVSKYQQSPATNSSVNLFDENSCDSGFAESSNCQYATDADDIEESFELFDKFDSKLSIESPFLTFKKADKQQKLDSVRHLKAKSKSLGTNIENSTSSSAFDEQVIKHALDLHHNHHSNNSSERFIGDLSRKHTLPILNKSKHNDLASISPKTLSELLNGKYDEKIGKYMVLDARYPYEFEGGHIHCAENVYEKENLIKKLFEQPMESVDNKPVVLIFHCEFSSERGPKL